VLLCYHVLLRLLQGRPVYIQLLGKIDISTLKQITTEERMIKFHIQEYERCGKVIMPICSRLAGRQIDQTFGIMDVKGESGACCVGSGQGASEALAVACRTDRLTAAAASGALPSSWQQQRYQGH
jgi:predicted HTH domain antitoxin